MTLPLPELAHLPAWLSVTDNVREDDPCEWRGDCPVCSSVGTFFIRVGMSLPVYAKCTSCKRPFADYYSAIAKRLLQQRGQK